MRPDRSNHPPAGASPKALRPSTLLACCCRAALAILALTLFGDPAAFAQDADGWTTPWATLLGVELESELNSDGPAEWDMETARTVFIATDGLGFGGLTGGAGIQQKQPGLSIFDGASSGVIASAHFNVLSWGWGDALEPHGLGVSPDGAWIYLPTGERFADRTSVGRLLIINARTLKVDKVLQMPGKPHLIKAFRDTDGNARVLVESFNSTLQPSFVLDPDDDNKVVGGWTSDQLGGARSSASFIDPSGANAIVVGQVPAGSDMAGTYAAWIDTKTWQVTDRIKLPDITPLWVAFTADNRHAFLNDARGEAVFRYDRATDDITAQAGSGVERPFGAHFDWQDRILISIGQDPASQTRGRAIGLLDTQQMGDAQFYPIDCSRANHATLHPDSAVNALWITCDATGEVIVFDMAQREVTARLALPDGGSIHAGAFVRYGDGAGEVVSDLNGLQGSALAEKRKALGLQ